MKKASTHGDHSSNYSNKPHSTQMQIKPQLQGTSSASGNHSNLLVGSHSKGQRPSAYQHMKPSAQKMTLNITSIKDIKPPYTRGEAKYEGSHGHGQPQRTNFFMQKSVKPGGSN